MLSRQPATASSRPTCPGSADASSNRRVDFVAFAVDLLDGPAAIVGCSFGGRVALEITGSRPDLVRRLVLVAPGLGSTAWSADSQAGFAEEEARLERGDLAGAAEHGPDVARPGRARPRCAR